MSEPAARPAKPVFGAEPQAVKLDVLFRDQKSSLTRFFTRYRASNDDAQDMTQEVFAEMNPSVLYDLQKYHPAAYRKFHEFKYGFLYKVISNNLERGVKEELYRSDIDIDVLTRLRIESVMLPFNAEVFPNNRTHLIHIEQQLFEHFLHGLVTTKGQKLIQKYKTQRTKK